jgi:hypothetical protein
MAEMGIRKKKVMGQFKIIILPKLLTPIEIHLSNESKWLGDPIRFVSGKHAFL